MEINKNRFFAILLSIVMLSALLFMEVSGETRVDKDRPCILTLTFAPEDLKASGVKFKAYKVASVTDSYEFSVEPEFENQEITKLLENPDSQSYSLIASTLSGIIASDSSLKPYSAAITNSSGTAVFGDLKVGLYLIIGEVYKGEKAYYTPQNFMVSLPERSSDGLWNYDIFAETKWEKRLRDDILNLKVLKVWGDSAENLHANDNVTVELYENGKLYSTQILNKNNNWSYEWKNLNIGASFTVKEKDIEGYISSVERKEDCFVITNTPKEAIKKPAPIPQTGLLWWPVPMLISVGILLIFVGAYLKRKGEK